jgi:hypothetical protein
MVQHLDIATTIVEAILSGSLIAGTQGVDFIARREKEMKDIASLLSPQLKQRYGLINFLKGRAQNQVTVV